MRREESSDPAAHRPCAADLRPERVADKEMGGRRVGALHWGSITADFRERGGKPFRVAREERAGGIGEVFAAARDGELDKLGGKRSENDADDGENHKDGTPLLVVAAATTVKRHP